jgi:hypothetical protein
MLVLLHMSNPPPIEALTESARTGKLSANTMVNPSFIQIEMTNERKSILYT